MRENFLTCLNKTLFVEGGYVNHRLDNGHCTNRGVTIGTLAAWRHEPVTCENVALLSEEEARQIYASLYWNPVRGDDLPKGVDMMVFDAAVHHGVRRSSRWLQEIVGCGVDGFVGNSTLLWTRRCCTSAITLGKTIDYLVHKRMEFMRAHEDWGEFGDGWTNRVRQVAAAAHQMNGGF